MHRSLGVLFLVLVMLASACGGSGADSSASGQADDGDTNVTESRDAISEDDEASKADDADADGSGSADADGASADDSTDALDTGSDEPASDGTGSELAAAYADQDSPLESLLGFDGFEDPAFLVDMQREVDEKIKVCMLKEGFDYIAQDLDPNDLAFGRSLPPNLSDEEFAAQYGYGVAASVDTFIRLANTENPSDAMLREMSEGERDAWMHAMLGAEVTTDPETGETVDPETGEPIDFMVLMMQGQGCASRANAEVLSSLQAMFVLESEFVDLGERFNSDRRVVEITGTWASCMVEVGFDYAALGEPAADFDAQVQSVLAPIFETMGEVPGIAEREQVALTPDQEAQVDKLAQEEIAVAIADTECLSGYKEELDEINKNYELEFIEANADTLAGFAN